MPVDFEKYSADDGRIDITEGMNARTLLSFLLEIPGVGFTPAELHDQTGIPRGSVNPTLARLERAGLVRHNSDYWAAATAPVIGLGGRRDLRRVISSVDLLSDRYIASAEYRG